MVRLVRRPRRYARAERAWPFAGPLALLALATVGCFEERAIPMRPTDFVRIPAVASSNGEVHGVNARQWLARAHEELKHRLPWRDRHALMTADMIDDRGRPRDVYTALGQPRDQLNSLLLNFDGFVHTAQGASQAPALEDYPPAWEGFEDIWIPVDESFALSGRLGLAVENGKPLRTDCIIVLPGFLGDNAVQRTRALCIALREHGLHALALELRSHGMTERRYPGVKYTFGALETQDLLRVDEWLRAEMPCVARTGLLGFCWGGNLALLAAWFDGRRGDDPDIGPTLAGHFDPPSAEPHFAAGVMAFSAILDWEHIVDRTDRPCDKWQDPLAYYFQQTVAWRMARQHYPNVSGNLRELILHEFTRSALSACFPVREGYRFLRFLPYRASAVGDKLEHARVPVVIAHAANDPFASAQAVADLMSRTANPNVAAIIYRDGGHVGFLPYARSYMYSLILNFFARCPSASSD